MILLCLAGAFLSAAAAAIFLPMGGAYIFVGLAFIAAAIYFLLVADADIRLSRLDDRRTRR